MKVSIQQKQLYQKILTEYGKDIFILNPWLKESLLKVVPEIWKDIEGFEGYYQVSNYGNVKSLGKSKGVGIGHYKRKEKLFIPGTVQNGYKRVQFYKKTFLIHRLVGQAFLPKTENKNVINHKDNNTDNNYFLNLQWVTQSENIQYAYDQKRKVSPFKEKPVIKMDKTGKTLKEYPSAQHAIKDGYCFRSISAVCVGRAKTHRKFYWKFKKVN